MNKTCTTCDHKKESHHKTTGKCFVRYDINLDNTQCDCSKYNEKVNNK